MRVWCVATGATGSAVAARLVEADVDVLVLVDDADTARALHDPGIDVVGAGVARRTQLPADVKGNVSALLAHPADVVLVDVEPQAVAAELESLVPYLMSSTDVVLLRSGLPSDFESVGGDRVIVCVADFPAKWIAPQRLSLAVGGQLSIGRLDGSIDARLERVRDLLGRAFPVRVTSNIRDEMRGRTSAERGPKSRRRMRVAWIVPALVAAAAVAVLVLWQSDRSDSPLSREGPPDVGTATPQSAVPASTPGDVGQSIRTLDGNTLTVYGVESETRPNRELVISPDEGKQLAAVDVEFCVREDFGSEGSVFENQFTVETRNDGVFPFWDVPDYAKDPRFASEPVGPGDCSRGWITFQIPDGERIERVHWRPVKDSPESLSWEVGGS